MIQSIDDIFTLAPHTACPKKEPLYLIGSHTRIFRGNISLARKFPFSNKCKCKMVISLLTLFKNNDQNTSFRHFILVKNQDYWWKNAVDHENQWSWSLGCIWWCKPVKLMIGMCSMQLCHWSLTNIEGHGKILVLSRCSWWWWRWWKIMREKKIQESFLSLFWNDIGYCIMLDMMDELFWGLTQRVRSQILTETKAPRFSLGRWGKRWKITLKDP